MIKSFSLFENIDTDAITDYIVGMPSGEIINVTSDNITKLKNENLIKFSISKKYFIFKDANYKKVNDIITGSVNIQYIHHWMDRFKISNYKVNSDLSVDIIGNVKINKMNLNKIPIKFKKVEGNFDCSDNNLKNLLNSPEEIHGYFDCSGNHIYTLIGGPNFVKGEYYCCDNNLEDLNGYPDFCSGMDCSRNLINTLYGLPDILDAKFFIMKYNKLSNLKNGPIKTKSFDCSHNLITSLIGGIKEVDGTFDCTYNKLKSIAGMPVCNKVNYMDGNKIGEIDD